MSEQDPIMLLDTNVWMDYFDGERSGHQNAMALIQEAINRGYGILYSPTSAKDLFYMINLTLKKDARDRDGILTEDAALAAQEVAWSCIVNMSNVATAASVGMPQVWFAEHYRYMHNDFEDNLILATAETCKVDYFITNDRGLLGKTSCPSFTSADMLARLVHE